MGPTDLLVLTLVAVLFVCAVRAIARSGKDGCSGCGSKGACSAHATGGPCPAAERMLRNAEKNLGK